MQRWYFIISILALTIGTIANAQSIDLISRILYHDSYHAVGFNGQYAYCGGVHGLQVMHLTENDSLELVNVLDVRNIEGMAIDSIFLFLVTSVGLTVVEISDPANPQIISGLPLTRSGFLDLRYANSTLFILTRGSLFNSYLSLIDVSNPYEPNSITGVSLEYGYCGMIAADNLFHTLMGEWDLAYTIWRVYDISDPYDLRLVYGEQFEGEISGGLAISAYHNYVYIPFFGSTRIYDVSQPSSPQLIYEDSSFFFDDDVVVVDTVGYYGTSVYNFANPLHPEKISELNLGLTYRGFSLYDDKSALIKSYSDAEINRSTIIDWSNLLSPAIVDDYYAPGPIYDVTLRDNYAYIANGWMGLITLDISNPANPTVVSLLNSAGFIDNIHLTDDMIYTGTDFGFKLFTISNPMEPELLCNYYDYDFEARRVSIEDGYAYLIRAERSSPYNNMIAIFDVHDPTNPILINAIDINEDSFREIQVYDGYAYLANRYHTFAIYDVHDPYSTIRLGSYAKHSEYPDFEIEFPYVYFCSLYNGLEIANIADPTNPYFINQSDSGSVQAWYVNVEDGLAYASHEDSLNIYDVSDPYNIRFICSYSPSGIHSYSRRRVKVQGEYIYDPSIRYFQMLRFTPTGIEPVSLLPAAFSLSPNYPNPFNASTTIRLSLPETAPVTLDIYDLLGRRVETLYNGPQPPGEHSLIWHADGFSSGVYFYKLTAGEFEQTEKMVLLK